MAYQIKHLKLGGILDQTIAIVRDRFGLLMSIMLVLWVPYTLLAAIVEYANTPSLPPNPSLQDMMRAREETQFGSLQFFLGLGSLLVLTLTNAAVIQAVARTYLGEAITAAGAMSYAFARLVPLVLTSILMILAIAFGYLLLIIPGILFTLWFALTQHVVIIEKTSGVAALKRSKFLMSDHLGTYMLLGLTVFVIALVCGGVAAFIPQPLAIPVNVVLNAALTLFSTTAFVIFYFSCRCDKENFDLQHLAASIGTSTSAEDAGIMPAEL